MGFSMMLVFMKVVYTRGNIAIVLTRPGRVSLYTRVCVERNGHDAGGWFSSSPGYNCWLCYCCPISIERRKALLPVHIPILFFMCISATA